jgi:aminobenzoyl-glutamate utilization protein B
VVPTGAMAFPASVPGINYHNWQAGVTPTMSLAHKGMLVGAKVLAASLLDLLTSDQLRQKARAEWEEATKKGQYFSILPADAKPPLDLNRDMMERYRPEMRKYYLNKTVEFK